MFDDSLMLMLALAGTLVVSAAVTFMVSRAMYGSKLGELLARLDKVEKSRARTNEMLLQARRQTEMLQKELVAARRGKRVGSQDAPADKPAAVEGSAGTPADAQAEARRRAEALMAEGDAAAAQRSASGFAETQPLSGFGPAVR